MLPDLANLTRMGGIMVLVRNAAEQNTLCEKVGEK
jgi:hypothetical protein